MTPELIAAFRVDRSGWPAGPWDSEPDRVDFHHAGFACLALRAGRQGNWCGYVGVPKDHPAYGGDYNDLDVQVHGGLTYGSACDGERICHVPAPGESDDLWWLGFDCLHFRDRAPGFSFHADPDAEYRTLTYVRNEIESLADQLAAVRAMVQA